MRFNDRSISNVTVVVLLKHTSYFRWNTSKPGSHEDFMLFGPEGFNYGPTINRKHHITHLQRPAAWFSSLSPSGQDPPTDVPLGDLKGQLTGGI